MSAPAWTPAEEAELRAVFSHLVIARDHSFEECMRVPAFATAIRNTALALRHAPRDLFEPEAHA